MMTSLNEINIFYLKSLAKNLQIKTSVYVEDNSLQQIICLVCDNNELIVRSSYRGETPSRVTIKVVTWFRDANKSIQDVCFDPSGAMLLVLCYDNTLHTVPVLWILHQTTTTSEEFHLAYDKITSFIVPFAGPHECPNSKTCPNNNHHQNTDELSNSSSSSSKPPSMNSDRYGPAAEYVEENFSTYEIDDLNSLYSSFFGNVVHRNGGPQVVDCKFDDTVGANDSIANSLPDTISEESSTQTPCPYPTAVIWWQTIDGKHCAIIGYSDGSICIVDLRPNCPLIASTNISNGGVAKLFICRDYTMNNVTLMINSTAKEQWKLLLEQKSIGYVYPGEVNHPIGPSTSKQTSSNKRSLNQKDFSSKSIEDDWQIIIPLDGGLQKEDDDQQAANTTDGDDDCKCSPLKNFTQPKDPFDMNYVGQSQSAGLLPAARARLASLRDLGAKKIGALKLKLVDSKLRSTEKERIKEQMTTFAIMDEPATSPEILTTPSGPFFILQCIKGTNLLSALHSYSDTLSVHSMNISLVPMNIYKIPKKCSSILVTPTFMYTIQRIDVEESQPELNSRTPSVSSSRSQQSWTDNSVDNAVGIVSCNTTTLQIGEDSEFNGSSLLSLFKFSDEIILNIHRVSWPDIEATRDGDTATECLNTNLKENCRSTQRYVENREMFDKADEYENDIRKLMQTEFPKIEMDKCIVVTNRNVYMIELREPPHVIFLSIAKKEQWKLCEEFCKIFNLNFGNCIEYVADVLLKQKKTTQALLAYNVARIPPVKTALKLAMHGENGALMHLCAMALKIVYILKSKYSANHYVDYLKDTVEYQESFELIRKKKESKKSSQKSKDDLIIGTHTSDFSYNKDETGNNLNLSNSSQFHLSNLLLLTLAEKTIKEKQYLPLWNFLVLNKRYHTKMTSIVLCQSGLYYSALLLACARGAHLDAFCGLVGVLGDGKYGWYSELNKVLINMSDSMFMECILYLPGVSIDYLSIIQSKIDKVEQKVLEQLRIQLDPFSSIYRPVVSQLSSNSSETNPNETVNESADFCKLLIETFLIVLIKLYAQKNLNDNFRNALNSIYVNHEEDQFAINVENCPPISAGFSHCACIIDGSVYFWGSNGVNCALSCNITQETSDSYNSPRKLQFIADLGLEAHAVKCGGSHTLILTNNGLYSMGINNLGQLGIGQYAAMALQPMLIHEFDGKNITMIDAGQYHNAVVADGCLYTWGWGLHGQLGHGSVENAYKPKIVSFFENKQIKQISLGHAHSLVLCSRDNTSSSSSSSDTILYVFGSNHFGQLGLGQSPQHLNHQSDILHNSFLKSLFPVELALHQNIRLIHTKFFTNLVVTQNNQLYTWGASSQALRLQNQARKRAKASQKKDEAAKDDRINDNACNTQLRTCDDTTIQKNESNTKDSSIVVVADGSMKNSFKSKSMNDLSSITKEKDQQKQPTRDPKSNLQKSESFEEESTDHLLPSLVDTSEVIGNIMQLSTGLYHYTLITDKCHLYTWGKNFEKQIGRDNSRNECVNPTLLDTIESPLYVECGADFTLVMTMDYAVKAFGSNSYGQCGRDLNMEKSNTASKLVLLRMSKRVVRIPDSSQCYEMPLNVDLPRPKIKMDFDPVRYLKSLPKFKRRFIIRNRLGGNESIRPSHASTIESNLGTILEQDSDFISQLDNLRISECNQNILDSYASEEETMNDINSTVAQAISNGFPVDSEHEFYPNDFIHYCLFIFHGIYNPTKIIEISMQKEFKVRVLMLNYRITEAFSLCISAAKTAHEAITIFEYFTKDSSIIPIHREDLKFLIYELFMTFINNNFNIGEIEEFLMADLDYYLLALAYVLYFSNNNTELERQVSAKYSHLFETDSDFPNTLLNSELIFKTVSIAFKARICQRLLDFDNNF